MSLKSGKSLPHTPVRGYDTGSKGTHRAPSRLRSPYAIGGLGVAVTAAVLATLVPARASTTDPDHDRGTDPAP
ncbi:hypothetical protein JBE04_15250, partial [Streptomyces sp. PRKS01-29]|nr:hypothetical protein [Streptomyces sabulosicollis]